jgi:hypothetical protein
MYATFVVELLLDKHGDVRATRAVHVQTATEQRWAGWDEVRLLAFFSHTGRPSADDETSNPPREN